MNRDRSDLPAYGVHVLRYATVASRLRAENLVVTTPDQAGRATEPMPIDYYVWTVHGPDGPTVIDTGFSRPVGDRRGRTTLADVGTLLRSVDVEPAEVERVVLTHLHYDHAGNLDLFPAARFLVQDDEIRFVREERTQVPYFQHPYEPADVEHLIAAEREGRVERLRGSVPLAPGLELYRVGGHTGGTQVVRVHTERGWLVLASDALHFTENRRARTPFPLVCDVREMAAGWVLCEQLADDEDLIIPGHDPVVMAMGTRVDEHVRRLA